MTGGSLSSHEETIVVLVGAGWTTGLGYRATVSDILLAPSRADPATFPQRTLNGSKLDMFGLYRQVCRWLNMCSQKPGKNVVSVCVPLQLTLPAALPPPIYLLASTPAHVPASAAPPATTGHVPGPGGGPAGGPPPPPPPPPAPPPPPGPRARGGASVGLVGV
jgi:hypothetical protein